jgi:hypothetical protein|eukprot:COSAG02_NODE_3019_length_7535_cov_9.178456_7_plen_151_part_00
MVVAERSCIAIGRASWREKIVVAFADSCRGTVAISSTCRLRVAIIAAVVTEVVFVTSALTVVSALSLSAACHVWVTKDAATGVGIGVVEVRGARIARRAIVMAIADAHATGTTLSVTATRCGVIAVHSTCFAVELYITRLTMLPCETIVA